MSAPERAAFVRDGYLVLHRSLSAELIAELLDTLEVDEVQVQDLPRSAGQGLPDRFCLLS